MRWLLDFFETADALVFGQKGQHSLRSRWDQGQEFLLHLLKRISRASS